MRLLSGTNQHLYVGNEPKPSICRQYFYCLTVSKEISEIGPIVRHVHHKSSQGEGIEVMSRQPQGLVESVPEYNMPLITEDLVLN